MTKTRSISFIKTFPSFTEAQDYAKKLAVNSIVIHLCGNDGQDVFTICAQEHIDALQEALNETVKELVNPKREWIGLTDEDRENIVNNSMTPACVAITTEAKLRSKNGY